ncbi:hypothetical protein [Metabacillus sp. RGM 3146]|uniref:hypothetical protein n=1 Tax=Metabacillus sp. RGM 3146 TaxID=3401092 RepID=UPI003B9D3368
MNPISAVMKIHSRYRLTLFYLPWLTSIGSLAINIIIASFVRTHEGFYTGGMMTIFVFMFVAGIVIPSQTFPFSIDMSLRRRDFFAGTLAVMFLVSIVSAPLLSLFSFLESHVTSGWGFNIHFFSLLNVFSDNTFWQIWIFLTLFAWNFMLGFVISSLYQRFGKNGMYIFFPLLGLLFTGLSFIFTYFQWWSPVFGFVAHQPNLLALAMILISAIFAFFSYLLLRRATI